MVHADTVTNQPPFKKHHILYIEDNKIVQYAYKKILERNGYVVDSATTGKDAMEKYQQNTYQLIILDGSLPDIDGFELGKRMRILNTSNNRIPFILLSAYPYADTDRLCKEFDIDAFAIKPILFTNLQHILARWIKN